MVVIKNPKLLTQYSEHLMYDMSFMVSKHCDLKCTFCMYSSGPNVIDLIDMQQFHTWMKTVRWGFINSVGMYGGEPTLFLAEYEHILNNCNQTVPKFMITNGTCLNRA